MTVQLTAEAPPLVRDPSGRIRIAGTRIPLETALSAYRAGLTPEQIVDEYPTLFLADLYAVIGYYLRHQQEIDEYLRDRRQLAERTIAAIDRHSPQKGLRNTLKKRLRRR